MKELHIHGAEIRVRIDGQEVYCDTVDNFAHDCHVKHGWQLPDGSHERYYMPGDRHYTMHGKVEQTHPLPWKDGDKILDKVSQLLDKKTGRLDNAAAAEEQKRYKKTVAGRRNRR